MLELISGNNEVFRAFAFWNSILIAKMLLMSVLTGLQRFKTKVIIIFINYLKLEINIENITYTESKSNR